MNLPRWIWGGNAKGFLNASQLRGRLVDERNEMWTVQTDESYYRQNNPGLIEARKVASERGNIQFERLAEIARENHVEIEDTTTHERIEDTYESMCSVGVHGIGATLASWERWRPPGLVTLAGLGVLAALAFSGAAPGWVGSDEE